MAATENIKLIKTSFQQANFTVDQGYFYTFDNQQDNLLQKTDDGNTSFSYPFDTLLANTSADAVRSAEFDGVYFWSLQNATNLTIRRWKIDNYVCKLQQTFEYTDSGSHTYDSTAFSVEHYHTQLSSAVVSGAMNIYFDDYWDDTTLMNFTTTSGAGLTIHLGPNANGEEEDVEVTATISGGVTISGATTQYAHAEDAPIHFYTYLWVFNNYDGISNATGALYKFDAYTGDYITRYAGGAYSAVNAATFYNVDSFPTYGIVDTLAYVKGTNTLFINIGAVGASLPYYGSMVMENIKLDEAAVITIYDICMDNQNIYRLQETPDGTATIWTYYSYLLSSLDAFVTSISLAAYPAIIAANTVATTGIVAIVKDQFLQPIIGRTVYFTEDDSVGVVVPGTDPTDGDGKAETTYTSGNTAREVKITAVVEQV